MHTPPHAHTYPKNADGQVLARRWAGSRSRMSFIDSTAKLCIDNVAESELPTRRKDYHVTTIAIFDRAICVFRRLHPGPRDGT